MLSNNLERTLRKALSIARDQKHEYATYEHLLLALIEDIDAKQVFDEINIDVKKLTSKLKDYLERDLINFTNPDTKEPKPTTGFQRIIQRAALHSKASGHTVITGINVLSEFFFEHDAFALLCLKEANLTQHDVLNYVKKIQNLEYKSSDPESIITKIALAENMQKANARIDRGDEVSNEKTESQSELEKYCINLNEQAIKDKIDCLIGRENEIQRAIEILCRRKKNNAILVGEPGVGKTAIAEGMATRIVRQDVPDILKNTVIYSLNIGSLVAGTKFRGDFEERIKNLLAILKKDKNSILFIDEIHTIIGAGSTTTGALDASNLLKPALANGELRCIGSTTFKEYRNHFEADAALARRFQKITVVEPNAETALAILRGLKGYYEKHHNVIYSDAALMAAVTLSERYIHDRHLPDKAIDLIDEAASRSKLHQSEKKKLIITDKDIEALLSSILNIPKLNIETSALLQLKQLSHNLKKHIFGQDEAINSLCSSIKLSRAGLRKGNRPTGCYLFSGQTGVGKTELAKQLAILCDMKLIKFDMSEFAESSSLSKLLGSAPGYVGFDKGGALSSEVEKNPYSVVLFDEIEKAHPDIYNLFLQIMDEGRLTDSTGKHINFTHTMIILTTNIIAEKEKSSIGFNDNKNTEEVVFNMDAINECFSPEFRGRLDNIILFNPIDSIIDKIVAKNLKELSSQLADKKIRLIVTQNLKKYLTKACFSKNNGARDLDRMIDSKIKQKIADGILFGPLKDGGTISLGFSEKTQEISFKFEGAKKLFKKDMEIS